MGDGEGDSLPCPATVAHVGAPVDQAEQVAAALDRAAAAIGEALAATGDWGEAGTRPGQHHSDLAADAAVVEVLTAAGLGVMSEESGRHGADRQVTVVVDPLDGSTNAARGLGWWATSLCAVDEHGPAVSLVVDLRHGTRWSARRGGGAMRDGEPLGAPTRRPLGEAIIGLNGVPSAHGGWAQYRALGAAALDLCAVADGTLDGYLDCTTDELGSWDYLGALLVCTEAGASAADAAGRDLVTLEHGDRRIPVAASSPELLAELLSLHPDHGESIQGHR